MTVLDDLKKPFPAKLIGKLPRITCAACSKKNCTEHQRRKCTICKGYLSTSHTHLDYVGHAEVTRRLLEVDPHWFWEPPTAEELDRLPKASPGEMWIKLTVHDDEGNAVTRFGFGDSAGKNSATKELIGDAIRNAAMRFGVALDLWSKERDDYIEEEGKAPAPKPVKPYGDWLAQIVACSDRGQLTKTGQEMAAAEIGDDDRVALRAEFTKRMTELKETS